jgi:hypothetical protein
MSVQAAVQEAEYADVRGIHMSFRHWRIFECITSVLNFPRANSMMAIRARSAMCLWLMPGLACNVASKADIFASTYLAASNG